VPGTMQQVRAVRKGVLRRDRVWSRS